MTEVTGSIAARSPVGGRVERRAPMIDPSGRPLERVGFEAVVALGIVFGWAVVLLAIIQSMGANRAESGPYASIMLTAIGFICWWAAGMIAERRLLVWPCSALGLVGPLSLGFAATFATPELRVAPHTTGVAIISGVSAIGMVPFLFRYRLPGLVSPVVTFSLVALFLSLYGADMGRIRQMEGFSPRGIVASLLDEPGFAVVFAVLGAAAAVLARRLDLKGDNFGLAAARPLHLIGNGVVALLIGRALGLLPPGLAIAGLAVAFVISWLWALRLNRIAVLFAMQFAMAKPLIVAIAEIRGVTLDIDTWTEVLVGMFIIQMITWPALHRLSRELDWTLGPGGRIPPAERPGMAIFWRYWPYATDESLTRWEAERTERDAKRAAKQTERRSSRRDRHHLGGADPGAETP